VRTSIAHTLDWAARHGVLVAYRQLTFGAPERVA
jgi:hypothetical protein